MIRGRFEIRNYQFNPELPPRLFLGGRVSTVPEAAREAFPFETGLYDQLREEGLESSAEIDAIREQAVAAVGRRYVSGLSPSRLYVPSVSSIYRYDRAELRPHARNPCVRGRGPAQEPRDARDQDSHEDRLSTDQNRSCSPWLRSRNVPMFLSESATRMSRFLRTVVFNSRNSKRTPQH